MDCPKCKRALQEDWKACPWCGTKAGALRKRSRSNGTGTAYKRGKTWTACITVGKTIGKNGKLRQLRKTKGGFSTKTEALKYCATLAEAPKQKPTPTLAYYYEVYSTGKMLKIGESKQVAYRIAFNKLGAVKNRPINTLTVGDLQELVNEKCQTYYPARDVRTLLSHLFKLAATEGNANASLPDLIEIPKLEEDQREPFTIDEQKLLWRSYENGDYYASIPLVMIYTGLMTGEMRKLTVEMVDLEKKEISSNVGLKTSVRKKSSVLLPDSILPVFEDILSRTPSGRLYPMSEDNFYKLYYGALERAGTRRLTPYSCRHTAATALTVDENIAPQIVQRLMRWSSTKMMDRYVHPSEENYREAINTRERL